MPFGVLRLLRAGRPTPIPHPPTPSPTLGEGENTDIQGIRYGGAAPYTLNIRSPHPSEQREMGGGSSRKFNHVLEPGRESVGIPGPGLGAGLSGRCTSG